MSGFAWHLARIPDLMNTQGALARLTFHLQRTTLERPRLLYRNTLPNRLRLPSGNRREGLDGGEANRTQSGGRSMRVLASGQVCNEAESGASGRGIDRSVRAARLCFSIRRIRRSAWRGKFLRLWCRTRSRVRQSERETYQRRACRTRGLKSCEKPLHSNASPRRARSVRACAITKQRAASSARDRTDPTNPQAQSEKPRETGPTDKNSIATNSPATTTEQPKSAEFELPVPRPRCLLPPVKINGSE